MNSVKNERLILIVAAFIVLIGVITYTPFGKVAGTRLMHRISPESVYTSASGTDVSPADVQVSPAAPAVIGYKVTAEPNEFTQTEKSAAKEIYTAVSDPNTTVTIYHVKGSYTDTLSNARIFIAGKPAAEGLTMEKVPASLGFAVEGGASLDSSRTSVYAADDGNGGSYLIICRCTIGNYDVYGRLFKHIVSSFELVTAPVAETAAAEAIPAQPASV